MNLTLPLAGKRIWVTRPREQAGPLLDLIREQGGDAILFPLIEILGPSDPEKLEKIIARLPRYDLAIFISPTSVERGINHLLSRGNWPMGMVVAAIGQGTARRLRARGLDKVIAPAGAADSEALLALPEMNQVSGKHIVIFRGEGGRELLAETLRQRGAKVDYAECYRRARPPASRLALPEGNQLGALDGIVITSSEAVANLFALADAKQREMVRRIPMFVPHARIADAARQQGAARVVVSEGGDAGLLQGMVKFFQS